MSDQYSRTELLFGKEGMQRLRAARVAVFGIGGVGGYAVEALARSGVGAIDLIDSDKVCLSNLNRQIVATRKTVGMYKVDVAAERIAEIDPSIRVTKHKIFYLPETSELFDLKAFDHVIDAIDTVSGKIELVLQAQKAGVPIISSMGAGNKLDPSAFLVADIYETSVCPLARVMRRELKKRNVPSLKVVYSKEPPITPIISNEGAVSSPREEAAFPSGAVPSPCEAEASLSGAERETTARRQTPGSVAFVPSVCGLIIAGEVIKALLRSPEHSSPAPSGSSPVL